MIHYPGSIGSVSNHPGAIRGRSAGDRGLAETSDGREISQYADFVAQVRMLPLCNRAVSDVSGWCNLETQHPILEEER